MTTSVAILVPTLRRPHALAPLLDSLDENTPAGIFSVWFVLDRDDDESYREIERLRSAGRSYIRVLVCDGTYPRKINSAVAATETPWVLLTADDVRFHPGWWEEAMAAELRHLEQAPAPITKERLGVIGTCDLHNRHTVSGKYATQILVARWYIDDPGAAHGEPGKAFHEGYHHNYVDREICDLAMARGVWVHAPASIIEHLHPDHGNREVDETDQKGQRSNRDRDKALFCERQKLWATSVS